MINQTEREQINQYSADELLGTLSLSVMRDNIQSQIDDANTSDRDFLSVVRGKFDVIKEGDYDSETMSLVNQEIGKFYNEIVTKIIGKFKLVYGSSDDLEEVADTLYNFFVYQRRSNTECFLETYIDENMRSIIEQLGLDKNTDVMTTTTVQKSSDPDAARIAANINTVIDYIFSMNISSDEFLDVLSSTGDYYVAKMIEYADAGEIDGHYPTLYMKEIMSEYDSDYASEIRNTLRVNFGMRGR